MNTRLFINDREVELDNRVDFAINRAFEDIKNPTNIINEWSKTVDIPFTSNNNLLFGSIFSVDRQITTGSDQTTGIHFDPTKKANFKLLYNQELLMQGYCKLASVTINSSKSRYNMNLFGQLGNIFLELQQLSFNPDVETDPNNLKYTIGVLQGYDEEEKPIYVRYIDEVMNKDLVTQSWTEEPQHLDLTQATTNDIIGFACSNQGFNPDFDSKAINVFTDSPSGLDGFNTSIEDYLTKYYEEQGITPTVAPSVAVGDGLLPRQMGEYRSYYQIPYIYVNKMIQMLQRKCLELTGYEMVLDSNWFNESNPYYSKLVMMLNRPTVSNKNDYDLQCKIAFNEGESHTLTYGNIQAGQKLDYDTSIIGVGSSVIEDNKFILTPSYSLTIKSGGRIKVVWNNAGGTQYREGGVRMSENNRLVIDTIAVNPTTGAQKRIGRTYAVHPQDPLEPTYWYNVVRIPFFDGSVDFYKDIDFEYEGTVSYTELGEECHIKTYVYWENSNYPLIFNPMYEPIAIYFGTDPNHKMTLYSYNRTDLTPTPVRVGHANRSKSVFRLEYVWDEKTSFFDCILNYCKTYGIVFDIDNATSTVTLIHRSDYFKDHSIADWSDKLDRTKDFVISPVSFDTRYVSFNYSDDATDYGKRYKSQYNLNYGDLKIKTQYHFNNENTDLFNDLKTSITNTATVLPFDSIRQSKFIYYQSSEVMPYKQDDSNKPTETFGSFYIYNGLGSFDTELGPVRITDDSSQETKNQKFMYTQLVDTDQKVTTYPVLDILYEDKLCLFNTPSESYDIMKSYKDSSSIYEQFWKRFIDDQYNIQNKKITCYLHITPLDYLNYKPNHFIVIHNQLYLLNKIIDYDITSQDTTKCELIGVQDINNYQY